MSDYRLITKERAMEEPLSHAWQNASIPAQQLQLTDGELLRWAKGESIAPYDALRSCMQSIPAGSVLEVGCGAGHNADVIQQSSEFTYTGVDYSEEFIRVAKERRSWVDFAVMDALMLDYQDKQFDCVVSGCCLIHIVNWRQALAEAARVARKFLVLHRTPITPGDTLYYFKKAYGVDCVELTFNEQELLAEVTALRFRLRAQYPVQKDNVTYLMERNDGR